MTKDSRDIRIFPDLHSLSQAAAEIFLDTAGRSSDTGKDFSVALSGGSTPGMLYALLGSTPYRERVDWRMVHVFWTDERCVFPEHEDSNFRLAWKALLSRVSLPETNIHRIQGEQGPETGATEYESEMRQHFGFDEPPEFDLILLGVGDDGHTASLFPGSEALHEAFRLAVPVYRRQPEHNRISLTLPVLNAASHVVFLVSGSSKSGIVTRILSKEERSGHYPAELVHPVHGHVTWLLDEAAVAESPWLSGAVRR